MPAVPSEFGTVASYIITVLIMVIVAMFSAWMREIAGRRQDGEQAKAAEKAAIESTRNNYTQVLEQYERRCDKQRLQDKENQKEVIALITTNLQTRDELLGQLTRAVENLATGKRS